MRRNTKLDESMAARGFLPVSVAARALGVASMTLYRLIDAGEIEGEWAGPTSSARFVKVASIAKSGSPEWRARAKKLKV